MRRFKMIALAGLLTVAWFTATEGAALASDWCGENGVIRFSLAAGDSLVEVLETGEAVNGVTTVDVYAWLTDVAEVSRAGEKFLRVGGVEMKLSIEGAEAFLLQQKFPTQVLNVGAEIGTIIAGFVPGQRLNKGSTLIVQWQVMFQGRPENVRFGLDPAGTMSCATVEGCSEASPSAIYVGVESSNQLGAMFGAGYVPAWLNPSDEPDVTPVHCSQSYQDVGLFQ